MRCLPRRRWTTRTITTPSRLGRITEIVNITASRGGDVVEGEVVVAGFSKMNKRFSSTTQKSDEFIQSFHCREKRDQTKKVNLLLSGLFLLFYVSLRPTNFI